MKKILVAVDGSEAAAHAAKVAQALAAPTQTPLVLVYVVPPLFMPPELPLTVDPYPQEAVNAGQTVLNDLKKAIGAPSAATLVAKGPPAETIIALADQEGADLVVVGSKGRGAVSRMLIGTVTDRVVHLSSKPVLVVR